MGKDFSHATRNITNGFYGPGEDGNQGAVYLYGEGTGREDVGASPYKYRDPDSEGYSEHEFVQIYSSSGTAKPPRGTVNGQTSYYVNRGETIQVEFTLETNGTSSSLSNIPYGIYISNNNYITTSDTLLSSGTVNMGRSLPFTTKFTVTIPSSLVVGNYYYVGIIMDHTNQITEVFSGNNVAYIPVLIF